MGMVINRFDVYLIRLDPGSRKPDPENANLPGRVTKRAEPPYSHSHHRTDDDQRAALPYTHFLPLPG